MNLIKRIVMLMVTICCMFVFFGLNTKIKALDESTTYVFTSKLWEATNNSNVDNWTSGSIGYGTESCVRVTKSVSGAYGISPIEFSSAKTVKITYSSNTDGYGKIYVYSTSTPSPQSGYIVGEPLDVVKGTIETTVTFTAISPMDGYIQIFVTCDGGSIYINKAEIICESDRIEAFKINYTKTSMILGYSSNIINTPYYDTTATMSCTIGAQYMNTNKNYASELGLDDKIFTVNTDKGSSSNYPYIPSSKEYITLYCNNNNGSSLTVSSASGITISKVIVTYSTGTNYVPGTFTSDQNPVINGDEYIFNTPATTFTIQNTNAATKTIQVRITSLEIVYSGTLSTTTYTPSNVALRFGNCITKSMYDELNKKGNIVSYGVLAIKKTDLGTNELSASLEKVKDFKCTPVRVDSIGAVEEDTDGNGNYYQFAGVIENIPSTAYGEEFVAACYVCIDGTYYLMQTATFSVNSLATQYVNAEDTSSYSAHLGVLNSIKG